MSVIKELIRKEPNGSISFGNHSLNEKAKLEDFECNGDLYKVKTYKKMTKLERNDKFVYESVPGTSVSHFSMSEEKIEFSVEGTEDVQITLELEDETEYEVFVAGHSAGKMKTNLGGKLSVSVELEKEGEVQVVILK